MQKKVVTITLSKEAMEVMEKLKKQNSDFGFSISKFVNKLIVEYKK